VQPDDPAATIVEIGSKERIDVTDVITTNLEALRARRPDGEHLWVISVVYGLADPETALDTMVLDSTNLVGFQPIICLWCHAPYVNSGDPGPVCQA
jgi:hypothetical protein